MNINWTCAMLAAVVLTLGLGAYAEGYALNVTPERVAVEGADGAEVLVYNRIVPADVELTVDSGGFFHPFNTPEGVAVTGLRPEDHLYHRGIFMAWFEMRGELEADFWGWGEHAPTEDRVIMSRAISEVTAAADEARFTAENDWVAEDTVMVHERLEATVRQMAEGNVADLEYTITPTADTTLPQRAFSGFCFRTRIDGAIQPHDPDGEVDLPPVSHVDPESNWPGRPWYAYTIVLEDEDAEIGAAVIDHPDNPESHWHNSVGIGMLNPVIVSPGEIQLEAGEPFTLRYRAVTFDGDVPVGLLNSLAEEWGY